MTRTYYIQFFIFCLTLVTASVLACPSTARSADPVPGSSWVEPVTGMRFVWVEPGCFNMGCDDKSCGKDERPVHRVCLNGFWVAETETTRGQWERVMDQDPSEFKFSPDHPVERVSWDAAQRFILKLSAMNRGRYRLRLPSEAEWEYVCRMGLRNTRAGALKSDSSTRPVNEKPANRLGLHGMGDNTAEWVQDLYAPDAYAHHNVNNPIHSENGRDRVYRGDCWVSYPDVPRCTGRYHASPGSGDSCQGFRLAMSPETPQVPAGAKSSSEAEPASEKTPPTGGRVVSGGAKKAAASEKKPAVGVTNTLQSLRAGEEQGRLAVVFEAEKPFGKYSTFMLDSPPRMVLDLPGAWTSKVRKNLAVNGENLKQVRTAEHKDKLRVVFDLRKAPVSTPKITSNDTALSAVFNDRPVASGPAPAVSSATGAGTGSSTGSSAGSSRDKKVAASPKKSAPPPPLPAGATDNVLDGIRIYSRGNAASIELDTARPVGDFAYFQLDAPPRLVLNMGGKWSSKESRDFDPDERGVRRIVTKLLPDMLRLSMELDGKPGTPPKISKKENGLRIELSDIPMSARRTAAKPQAAAPAPAPHVALPPPNRLEKVDIFVDRGVMSIDFFTTQPVEDFSFAERDTPPGLSLALPGDWGVDIPSVRKTNRGELKQIRANKLTDRLLLTLVFKKRPDPVPVIKKTPHGLRVVLPADPEDADSAAGITEPAEKPDAPSAAPQPEQPASQTQPAAGRAGTSKGSILKPEAPGSDQVDKDTGFDFKSPAVEPASPPAQPMTGMPAATPPASKGKLPPLAALEDFRSQLMFTCKMSSASYQTLVWKHGNIPDNELETKIEPYKRVFEDIAFRKGSDVETWEKVQSPVYDLGVQLRRAGYEPTVCDNIRHFSREQLESLYDTTFNRGDRAGFQQLLKSDLIGRQ